MKRKIIVLLAAGTLALTAVGCAEEPHSSIGEQISGREDISMGDSLYWGERKLPDGRSVWCIIDKTSHGGGISCDWESAE